jgi:hypothetical protein
LARERTGADNDDRAPYSLVTLAEGGSQKMIRKLTSGDYRLYLEKKDKTGKRRNIATFKTRAAAEQLERALQYFKRRN